MTPSGKQIRDSFELPTMWPPPKPVLVVKDAPKIAKRAAA